MHRITHNLAQGSSAWHEHRQSHFNASEASAMMGASKHRTRASLLREKATGISEDVSDVRQKLFDRGHAAEASIRPEIERMLSEELFPVTVSVEIEGLPLSASLDGQTLTGETIFECKLWNEELAAQVRAGELAPHYYWQLEQQLLVSGAERAIFATGDGEGRLETLEYRAVPGRAEALIAGWEQFAADVAAYTPEAATVSTAVSRGPGQSLPTILANVEGSVSIVDNFSEFEALALDFLEHDLVRSPQTDEDFLTLDDQIKEMRKAEDALETAGQHILAQIDSVNSAIRRKDILKEMIRRNRLMAEKLLSAEKENRKAEIVQAGAAAVRAHYDQINATLGEHRIQPPQSLVLDLGAAIKGKKALASMKDAVDAAAAGAKIAGSQQAERVRQNIAVLEAEMGSYGTLFPDRVQLCATKQPDDLRNLIAARIAEHDRQEAERKADEDRKAQAVQASPAPEPAQPPPAPAAASPVLAAVSTPAAPPAARLKLGDINAAIAPLSITADGLASLGFRTVGSERAAKLYAGEDFPRICGKLIEVLQQAPVRAAQKAAA